MVRTQWERLPPGLRETIDGRTGGVISAAPASGGAAEIALIITTSAGRVFVKGVRCARAGIERRVQPFLPGLAPRMLWHATVDSWQLLAFEYIEGRHVDLAPGSSDLGVVADAASAIADVRCPDLPVLPVEKRWAPFAAPEQLNLLRGDSLVHTDLTVENLIVSDGRVRVVDWGWPSVGAPWLDSVALVARLIQAGHAPSDAQAWAECIPAWRDAPREGIRAYVDARSAVARRNSAAIHDAWETYRSWLGITAQ